MQQNVPKSQYAKDQYLARNRRSNLPTNGLPAKETRNASWSLDATIGENGGPVTSREFSVELPIRREHGSYIERRSTNDLESRQSSNLRRNWGAKERSNRDWDELQEPRDQVVATFSSDGINGKTFPNGIVAHDAVPQKYDGYYPEEMYKNPFRPKQNMVKFDKGEATVWVQNHGWDYHDIPQAPGEGGITIGPGNGSFPAPNDTQTYDRNSFAHVKTKPPYYDLSRFNSDPDTVLRENLNVNEGMYGTKRSMTNVEYQYWSAERTKPRTVRDPNKITWYGGDRPFGRVPTQSLLMNAPISKKWGTATRGAGETKWFGNGLDGEQPGWVGGMKFNPDMNENPFPLRLTTTYQTKAGVTPDGHKLPYQDMVQYGNDLPGPREQQAVDSLTNKDLTRYTYFHDQEGGGGAGKVPGQGDDVYKMGGIKTKMGQSEKSLLLGYRGENTQPLTEEWSGRNGVGEAALWNKGQKPGYRIHDTLLLNSANVPTGRSRETIAY